MARISDFDYFLRAFKPILNKNETKIDNEPYYMFETYGQEYQDVIEHMEKNGNECVWTILDFNGKLYLAPGWHYVNRKGYMLTTIPWKDGQRDYLY